MGCGTSAVLAPSSSYPQTAGYVEWAWEPEDRSNSGLFIFLTKSSSRNVPKYQGTRLEGYIDCDGVTTDRLPPELLPSNINLNHR